MALVLERAQNSAGPPGGWAAVLGGGPAGGLGAPFGARLGVRGRRRQLDAGAPRLREADRNRLFRGARAMLALADVMDLFAHELTSLGRRRLALPLVSACPFERFFFR